MLGLRVGDFVIRDVRKGIARIGSVRAASIRLEYFESVAEPVALTEEVGDRAYQVVTLSVGTRVYWRNADTGVWTSGRIAGHQGDRYFVRFPNADYDFPVPGVELRVRWNQPVKNPMLVLTTGGSESAYYYNARIPMLRNLVEQRAACANVPALLSSAVEIYPHQVMTALKVLSDPVQRYLLADEVGLGKTVEAGYVIRQILIDDPLAKITVVVPDLLRRQWLRELTSKFFTDDFPSARVKIVAHEKPTDWHKWHDSDLLVVDEAHLLVQVDGPDQSPYRELRALAHAVPRVLLLSATPLTSNVNTNLGLLHLIDPDLYSWDDRAAFEERYRLRSELADGVYSLDAEMSPLLPYAVARIRDVLPHDQQFEALAERVLSLLDDDGDFHHPDDLSQAKVLVEQLRAHISETYRLHRRTIRHRRAQVLKDDQERELPPYEVRGRSRPAPVTAPSRQQDAGHEAVRAWRSAVNDVLLDEGRTSEQERYAAVLAVLASRAGGPANDLVEVLRWRLRGRHERTERAGGLTAVERTVLAEAPVITAEAHVLSELETVLSTDWSALAIQAIIDAVLPVLKRHERTVLFCGAGSLAQEIANAMSKRFPQAVVCRHVRAEGAESAEAGLRRWAKKRGAVLIADDSAEDGLNLQGADAVVHLRMPWSPNGLEQRLGRVDRFPGTDVAALRDSARQYALVAGGDESAIGDAWFRLLSDGYWIFDRSVSILQDAIAEGLVAVWTRALSDGSSGLEAATDDVVVTLEEAVREINKFDMLESIHDSASPSLDVAEAMGAFEIRWRDVGAAMLNYTGSSSGGISITRSTQPLGTGRWYEFDPGRSRPHVDPRLFKAAVGGFGDLSATGTFNRSTALQFPGTRLFRVGNPFVDVLSTVISSDDRGQASAFWRIDPQHEGDSKLYFGFDFLVEADLTHALAVVDDVRSSLDAIRRQADRIFPPFTLKVWIDSETGMGVEAPRIVAWLNRSYDNQRDHNASGLALEELIKIVGGWEAFQNIGKSAEVTALSHVVETTELGRRCAEAEESVLKVLAVVRAQSDARRAAGKLVADNESFIADADLTAALAQGIREPVTRVVAVTCVVRKGLERSGQRG